MDGFKKLNTCVQNSSSLISDDLLIEILGRLPFKSLARFRCVSKAWYSLISDPSFQSRLCSPMVGLFYQKWDINEGQIGYVPVSNESWMGATDHFSLKFLPDYCQRRFMDCCNGLLLFLHGSARLPARRRRAYTESHDIPSLPGNPVVFYVCNPISRRWNRLPDCPTTNRLFDSVLVFDPTTSPHFKVVRIGFVNKTCSTLELAIFNSETGSWIKSNVTTAPHRCRLTNKGIVVHPDGLVYRLARDPKWLLRIDTVGGKVTKIEMPEGYWNCVPCFGLYQGKIHCALFLEGYRLRVWELCKEDLDASGELWVLKHTSCLGNQLRQKFGWFGRARLLAFHLHLKVIYIGLFNRIISYDFGSETMEECCGFSEKYHLMGDLKTRPYVPCFLDSLNDQAQKKPLE